MSNSSQRAAEQMARDGIRKLSAWGKPFKSGCATIRPHVGLPKCGESGCAKHARYSTPRGNRCFTHARPADPQPTGLVPVTARGA